MGTSAIEFSLVLGCSGAKQGFREPQFIQSTLQRPCVQTNPRVRLEEVRGPRRKALPQQEMRVQRRGSLGRVHMQFGLRLDQLEHVRERAVVRL